MQRLEQLGIREQDIEEQFIRSRGRGGQNVNKLATCVQLSCPREGITLRCETERSQRLNRYLARVRLAERLEEKIEGRRSARQQATEKIRRQKRKRSKRAKEKLLQEKHHRATLKATRTKPHSDE